MEKSNGSPQWNGSTKLIVSLTFVAAVAGLLVKFQGILPQLIITILLAYLFNPIADFISRKLHVPWVASVTLVYLLAALSLIGLLTLGGVGLAQQMENLIALILQGVQNIASLLTNLSGQVVNFGPLQIPLPEMKMATVGQQILTALEPQLVSTGTLVGALASNAANFLGWTVFVLLVSYFLLVESDGLWRGILNFNLPGYKTDLENMARHLAHIWNAFLRGQLIVMVMAAMVYSIVLSLLGVNYALGLALLAGLARFVPYVGPLSMWIILGLVSYFQDFKLFGLQPWAYALIVVGMAWIIDGITDNFIMPRIMASALKVHPAAVLVAAIVALDLLGILGVIIAAPMLATLQLVMRYFGRKLFDLDPWEGLAEAPQQPSLQTQISAGLGKVQEISASVLNAARLLYGRMRR